MNFVITTDVFIEGLLWNSGDSMRLIDNLFDERFSLVLDDRIYFEYFKALSIKKFALNKNYIDYILKFIKKTSRFINAERLKINSIKKSDLKFVEVAKTSKSSGLIVKNLDAFMSAQEITAVLSPHDVLEKYLR